MNLKDHRTSLGPVIIIDPLHILEGMTIEELRGRSDRQMRELPQLMKNPKVMELASALFQLAKE